VAEEEEEKEEERGASVSKLGWTLLRTLQVGQVTMERGAVLRGV